MVPSLGLGNVCQLSLDALLNTALHAGARVCHAATLHSAHVSAMAGARPFDLPPSGARGGDVCTALEVYTLPEAALAVLQQRSPALEGYHELWAEELARWAAACGIARIVAVTAIDAALRGDQELTAEGAQVVYIATAPDAAAAAMWKPWRGADGSLFSEVPTPLSKTGLDATEPIVPAAVAATRALMSDALGSGYTPVFFRRMLNNRLLGRGPLFTAIMIFASEGDNTTDALVLAGCIECYARQPAGSGLLQGARARPPLYWAQLHGPRPDQALYG